MPQNDLGCRKHKPRRPVGAAEDAGINRHEGVLRTVFSAEGGVALSNRPSCRAVWGKKGGSVAPGPRRATRAMGMSPEKIWLGIGFLAQALFSARFLVQWIASERAKRSVVPVAFWVLSVFGGALLLAYALWRRDPVFIVGQGAGLIVYSRNLYFIYREKRAPWESERG